MIWAPPGGWDLEGWSIHCLAGMALALPAVAAHQPWLAVFIALAAGCVHEQAQSGTIIRWLFEVPRLLDIAAFLPGAIILAVVWR
jgi:hypothetical protein